MGAFLDIRILELEKLFDRVKNGEIHLLEELRYKLRKLVLICKISKANIRMEDVERILKLEKEVQQLEENQQVISPAELLRKKPDPVDIRWGLDEGGPQAVAPQDKPKRSVVGKKFIFDAMERSRRPLPVVHADDNLSSPNKA